MLNDRLPHDVQAEEACLGSILIEPRLIDLVSSVVGPEDFYIERHNFIYHAMLGLQNKSIPIDLITLGDELDSKPDKYGGQAYLTRLMNTTPTSIHGEHYANIVRNKALLRRLIDTAGTLAKLSHRPSAEVQGVVDEAEKMLSQISARNGGQFKDIKTSLSEFNERTEMLANNDQKIIGLPTGLVDLDKLTGGLQDEDYIVLAGRPGMGKTSLALTILRNITRQGKCGAIASLEMSDHQLINRLVSMESGINSQRLKLGNIYENEWASYFSAINAIGERHLFINDFSTLSAQGLKSHTRRLYDQVGLDLLIIDYLQLMNGGSGSENRQQEISVISRTVKQLARELKIPILALSQLNREVENRGDKRPRLSDLRESGSIEQDADIVIFIYRDEVYNPETEFVNVAELDVGKHRHGPTGSLMTYFKKSTTEFKDLEINRTPLDPQRNGHHDPSPHYANQL